MNKDDPKNPPALDGEVFRHNTSYVLAVAPINGGMAVFRWNESRRGWEFASDSDERDTLTAWALDAEKRAGRAVEGLKKVREMLRDRHAIMMLGTMAFGRVEQVVLKTLREVGFRDGDDAVKVTEERTR